jgi:phage terminase small subunit
MRVAATVALAAKHWLGADGGLEEDLPEVKTRAEANRMLRVMSEDLGLRPRAESFVKGPGEDGGEGGEEERSGRDRGITTSTTTTTEEEGVEEEASLLF